MSSDDNCVRWIGCFCTIDSSDNGIPAFGPSFVESIVDFTPAANRGIDQFSLQIGYPIPN
jgi:hypothetical protein